MAKAISIPPSYNWANHHRWSTFPVQIGSQAEVVQLLPATSQDSIWVVGPSGCPEYPTSLAEVDCPDERGGLFAFLNSKSFDWVGGFGSTATLPFEPEFKLLGNYSQASAAQATCAVGQDTVILGFSGSNEPKLQKQFIRAYAQKFPYQGLLGLTARPSNLTLDSNKYMLDSVLSTLRKVGKIPSTYWAYTAGAWYKEPESYGSLTFGGYDALRGNVHNVLTVPLIEPETRDMLVKIMSIDIDDGPTIKSVGDLPVDAFVDSVVPEIWLPTKSCEAFESAFGLTWNEDLAMYLVSDAQHTQLVSQNASVAFTLGSATDDSSATTQVTLPYRAFDQIVMYPLVGAAEGAVNYFPLKRAARTDQVTLGRTFLQEAYVTADYDRWQFSVSQATFPAVGKGPEIRTVYPHGKSGLSTGAIVGIAVGAFVVLLLLVGAFFGRKWWKKRQERKPWFTKSGASDATDSQGTREFYGTKEKDDETYEKRKMELDAMDTARGTVATRQELESPEPRSPPPPFTPGSDRSHKHHGSVDSQASELEGYFGVRRTLSGSRPVELPGWTEEEQNRERFEMA